MNGITKIVLTILLSLIIGAGCIFSSAPIKPESENIVNAPVDVVWAKILEILPKERITLKIVDKKHYYILGKKGVTLWSKGDFIKWQLFAKDKKRTIVSFYIEPAQLLFDFGLSERMVKNIFHRIKTESETAFQMKP